MSKKPSSSSPRNPASQSSPQARKEAERAKAALDDKRQNDRTAGNASGMGSVGGARDMTSGKRSGNQ